MTNTRDILAEDKKRREFFFLQSERIAFYDSLICQMEDLMKQWVRIAPPAVFETDRVKLLLAKKIFKDNHEAFTLLLNCEIESIFQRAQSLARYGAEIAKNDMFFLEHYEIKCSEKTLELIRDYYAQLVLHADPAVREAAGKKRGEFLQ